MVPSVGVCGRVCAVSWLLGWGGCCELQGQGSSIRAVSWVLCCLLRSGESVAAAWFCRIRLSPARLPLIARGARPRVPREGTTVGADAVRSLGYGWGCVRGSIGVDL